MKLLDLNHPSFKPVWVRVAVVVVCAVWSVVEMVNGNAFWGIAFAGLAVICGYRFSVIDYNAIPDADATPRQDD
jgi:hypothetical protein